MSIDIIVVKTSTVKNVEVPNYVLTFRYDEDNLDIVRVTRHVREDDHDWDESVELSPQVAELFARAILEEMEEGFS